MTWIAGVDGFKARWFVVLLEVETRNLQARIIANFSDLLALDEQPTIIAVDIPIGLPEVAQPGGRACEQQARARLGLRRSSVFTAVGRNALSAATRAEADRQSRGAGGIGIGAQAWGLAQKLRDADAAMSPESQRVIHEVHPELCFWAMNRQVPMNASKKTSAGHSERIQLLERSSIPVRRLLDQHPRVGRDDVADACAALWTAQRILVNEATRLPTQPTLDGKGLDMAIWY